MNIKLPKSIRVWHTYITKRMRISIQALVIAFFLFATVVTATVAISLQYVFSRNLAAETTLTLFEKTTQTTQNYLRELDERASASIRVSAQFMHFNPDNSLKKESQILITEVMQRNPLFHAMYIGFENGDYVGVINLDADKQTRKAMGAEPSDRWVIMQINGKANSRKRSMQFVDSAFKVRDTRTIEAAFKANDRPWFVNAEKGKVHKTPPYLFQQMQTPGETYSMRLSKQKAVIGLDITLSALSDYLVSQNDHFGSEMYLFTPHGDLTASNQIAQPLNDLPAAPAMELTPAQQELVKKVPYINVSNEVDWPPISFAASGQPYGYTVDVLNYISDMTGIEIRYVNGLPWHQMAQMFLNDRIDILQPVFYDPTREWLGNLSDSFLDVPYGVLTKGGKITHINELSGKTVAIPEDWLLADNLKEKFPKIKVVEVPSVRAMFTAVREGKVEAAIDTSAILNYTAQQYFIDDVTISSPLAFDDAALPKTLHFMLTKTHPELKTLFNDALAQLGPEHKQALHNKWFSTDSDGQFSIGVMPYKELTKIAQQGGTQGLINVELKGRDYYTYVIPFGDYNDREEYFAIVTPVNNVLSASIDKVIEAIVITIGVLLFLLPLAWWLAGPFVEPIRRLATDSKHIAHRRYDRVGEVESPISEVHDLAVSMGDMSASIQQHEKAQQKLMDAFIKVIAQAIDDKSAHTAGHCERVPELALMLAAEAEKANFGIFEAFSFDTTEKWREFEVAAWLHDCGKITTPEHIIDKGTKLETIYNRIHEIRMRFEVLWRDAEIEYWTKLSEKGANQTALLEQKQIKQQQLQEDFAFIANANVGGEFMSEEDLQRLQELAKLEWQRHFDDRLGLSHIEAVRYPQGEQELPVTEQLLVDKDHHKIKRTRNTEFDPKFEIKMDVPENLYDMGELYNLSVQRGTLATEDRFKINEHIISTIKMLESLPFPEELSNVPRYASTHHETTIGTGYPRKLKGDQLSVPERVMVLADIYEALTAADRPYKKAKTISEAIKILSFMVKDKHVDQEVFELFLRSGVYLTYAQQFLPAEQIDDVDIEQYLS